MNSNTVSPPATMPSMPRRLFNAFLALVLLLGTCVSSTVLAALTSSKAYAATYIQVVDDDSFAPEGYDWYFDFAGVQNESGWKHVNDISEYLGETYTSSESESAVASAGDDCWAFEIDANTSTSTRPTLRFTGGKYNETAVDALVTLSDFEFWVPDGFSTSDFGGDDINKKDCGWIIYNPNYTSVSSEFGTKLTELTNINFFSSCLKSYQVEIRFVKSGTNQEVGVAGHMTCNDLDFNQSFSCSGNAVKYIEVSASSQEKYPPDITGTWAGNNKFSSWISLNKEKTVATGIGSIAANNSDGNYQRGLVACYFDTKKSENSFSPIIYNYSTANWGENVSDCEDKGNSVQLADGSWYTSYPTTFFAMTPEYIANPAIDTDYGMELTKAVNTECPVDTGDDISWILNTTLPVEGLNVRSGYVFSDFVITDHLSNYVTYKTDSARITLDGEELPDWAGEFVCYQDTSTKEWKLEYTFSHDYLKTLSLKGQLLEITFDTVAGEYPSSEVWDQTRLPIPNYFTITTNSSDVEETTVTSNTAYAEMIQPKKTINGDTKLVTEVGIGDTVTYAIEQEVHDIDVDHLTKYRAFSFSDTLPEYVVYKENSYKVTDSEGHEVPSDAGSFSYDKNTNTVKYEFNDNYLQNGMIYNGHAYKFEFQVTVVDQPDDDLATIDNYATVQANDLVEKTNVVSYTPISPVLQIEKHADLTNNLASAINEFEYLSHDQHADQFSTVHYIGSFQNTADKTRAKNVTMTDELPIGLSLVPGSVTATGADGIEITEDTVNNKIIITVTELDPWSPVTFSYDCYTTDEGNGKEIVNVADVWATNVQLSNPGSEDNHARDDGEIYINDPTIKLTKTVTESLIQNEDYQDTADHQREEYRVDDTFTYTVTMVNTTPGTFGRNVYLTDQDLPEGFELVGGLNVTGLTNNGKNKTLFYPMAGVSDSIHGEGETREINWSYTTVEKEDGTWGWELNLDYLPYNYPITVSWTVKATAETNGWEVYNQAYATAENQPGDTFYSDEPIVWINTPEFNVDKQVRKTDQAYQVGDVASYDVTLYGLKTPGTLARQTTLEDNFLQDGTTIIENSFVITDQQSNARDISSQVELNRYVGDQYWHIDMTQVYNDSTGYWVCSENYRYIWQDGVLIMVDSEKNPVGADAHDYMNVNYQATINDMALQNYYVENLATADSIEGFPGEDEATVTVIGPQLDINKTSYDGGSFVEGDIAAYEVTIRNLATGTLAEDVQITDGFTTAKAGAVAIVEGSIKLYDNQNNEITNFEVSYNTNEAGNIIGFGIDTNYNLAGGDKITLRYNVKYLTNNGSNVVKNVAKTWADNAPSVSDYYETWPSDNDQSDLIIDKGSDKQVYKQGDTGTYTLHITNQNANQVAENVVINDKITLDTLGIASVVKGSVKIWNSQGQGVSGKVTYTQAHGGQVNGFNIETGYDLASTDWLDVEYTVSFNANVTQATQIHNTCWASADNTGKATDENDVLVDSNRFTTPDEPEKEPETPVNPISPINPDPVTPSTPDDPEKSNPLLKIVKQSDKTQYETGDTATYTLRVNNTVEGSNPAKNVVITDHLDAASQNLAVIQKGSVKAISGNGQTISIKDISYSTNSKGETVGFTILTNYDLEYDDSIFVTYTATINEDIDASTSIVNKAYASADNASQVTDDNTVEVPVQGTNPEQPTSTKPNLEINKVASKTTATVGSPLTWTITVKQTVEGAQAANTVLEDEIPQGFTLSIDGVSVKDAEGNTLDKTWTITDRKLSVNLGDIAYNKPVIVTLVGNIDSEYEGKTMENTAVATSTNVDEPVQSTAKVTISNENTGNPDSPENDTDTPTSGTNTPTSGTNTTTPTSGSTVGSSGTKATSGTSGTTSGSSSKGLDQTGDMIISWAQDNWAALLGGVAVTVLGIWGASRFVKNED